MCSLLDQEASLLKMLIGEEFVVQPLSRIPLWELRPRRPLRDAKQFLAAMDSRQRALLRQAIGELTGFVYCDNGLDCIGLGKERVPEEAATWAVSPDVDIGKLYAALGGSAWAFYSSVDRLPRNLRECNMEALKGVALYEFVCNQRITFALTSEPLNTGWIVVLGVAPSQDKAGVGAQVRRAKAEEPSKDRGEGGE
jgi:hypothetical protein